MNNIITYAENTFDTFEKRSFCSVDSLILSWFSYIHLPPALIKGSAGNGIPLAGLFLAEYFEEMLGDVWSYENNKRLFTALMASPRFRDIRILDFVELLDTEQEKQFSAMTFKLGSDLYYISYRGTDSTLVGWKEDFNMAFKYPIPAQEEAVRYLTHAAEYCSGRILVGGHSKGGNLAVYAAMKADKSIQNQIDRIYSHDGPGFPEIVLEGEDFKRISSKIEKTIPQSSVVGILLEYQENYQIVKSNSISFGQHNPFSWIVTDNSFSYISKLTPGAIHLNRTINDWLKNSSIEERERFVEALYSILQTTDIASINDLRSDWHKNLPAVIHAASQLDGDTKHLLFRTLKGLASLSAKNVQYIFKDHKDS